MQDVLADSEQRSLSGPQEPTESVRSTSCHIARCGAVAVSYFLPFLLLLVLSFVVVLGLLLTVDCFTNRPVIALRPRLPPLDFDGTSAPFIACSHDAMTKLPLQPRNTCPCPRLGPSAVTG